MKRVVGIIALLLAAIQGFSQGSASYKGPPSLVWPKLYDIKYEKAKDESEFDKPIFSKAAKSLDGKIITLPGYIVPFENGKLKEKKIILTSLPLNACFFCGVGGPESIVEIYLKDEISYTESPVEVRGTLRLLANDPAGMIYRLEQAEFLGEVEF